MVYNVSLREWSVNLRVMLHSQMTADDVTSFVQAVIADNLDRVEDVVVVSAVENVGFESMP
jgi:uncharacterized protein YeeX (DUF496 family)